MIAVACFDPIFHVVLMALSSRLPRSFQCIFCARRLLHNDMSDAAAPFRRQFRGKKTFHVRLLKDTIGYGRRGKVFLFLAADWL